MLLFWKIKINSTRNYNLAYFIPNFGEGFAERGEEQQEANILQTGSSKRLLRRDFLSDKIPASEKKAHPTKACKVWSDKSKHSTGKHSMKESGIEIFSVCQIVSNSILYRSDDAETESRN